MGIDIYARWAGQTDTEQDCQRREAGSSQSGKVGYLHDASQREQYPSRYLLREAFGFVFSAPIPAKVLRERLEQTLFLVEERTRNDSYFVSEAEIARAKENYRAFVEFCDTVEKRTGQSVTIVAPWRRPTQGPAVTAAIVRMPRLPTPDLRSIPPGMPPQG
jgi:hypothetical protein